VPDQSDSGDGAELAPDSAVRDFVHSRYTHLVYLAYLLTGSTHDAEDLVQSALLRMLRRWERVEDPLNYARRTIMNLYLSGLRRRGREVLTALLPERPGPEGLDRIVQRGTLWPALRALPARTRAVIVARFWLDLSEAETARLLDCSIGTVKSSASRGLARLREELAPLAPAAVATIDELVPGKESR
jgi:RNA polymerase sigma-70 factor (sigma-E family)